MLALFSSCSANSTSSSPTATLMRTPRTTSVDIGEKSMSSTVCPLSSERSGSPSSVAPLALRLTGVPSRWTGSPERVSTTSLGFCEAVNFAPSTSICAQTSSSIVVVEYVTMAGCIITSALERALRIAAITLRVAPLIRAVLWPARMLTTLTVTIVAIMATITRSSIRVKALRAIGRSRQAVSCRTWTSPSCRCGCRLRCRIRRRHRPRSLHSACP